MLAEEAMPVADIDRAAVEASLKDLRENGADAKDEAEREAVEARIRVAEAKLAAVAEGG